MKPNKFRYLIACLGNPGNEYTLTRHNFGFMVADHLSRMQSAPLEMDKRLNSFVSRFDLRIKKSSKTVKPIASPTTLSPSSSSSSPIPPHPFQASPLQETSVIEPEIPQDAEVYVIQPQTFMNLSGTSVRKSMDLLGIPKKNVLVVFDDIDTAFGKMRLKPKGSSGGHNGLRSIEAHLKTQDYYRLKMGVGRSERVAVDHYVLSKFTPEERQLLPDLCTAGSQIVLEFVAEGADKAMYTANNFALPPERLKEVFW